MFINVDLPEPEGPTRARYSPFSMSSEAQSFHLDLTEVIDLPDIAKFDQSHESEMNPEPKI